MPKRSLAEEVVSEELTSNYESDESNESKDQDLIREENTKRARTFTLLKDEPWQQLAWLQEKGKVTVREDSETYFLEIPERARASWILTHAALFRRNHFERNAVTGRWVREKDAHPKISSLETLLPEGFLCRQKGWCDLEEDLQEF